MKKLKFAIMATLAAVTFGSAASAPAAAVTSASDQPVETQAAKTTTASGTKTCGKGDTVRLNVKYRRGLLSSKLIYNITRTSEKAIELPPLAGDPSPKDFYVEMEISTFQKKSSYYASVPKGREGWVKINPVCV